MTPQTFWIRIARLASAGMIASCAVSPPLSAEPPRLSLPQTATTPCVLHRLPGRPTEADLEIGYMSRGAQIVACDAARRLAVDTLLAERGLQDRWRASDRRSRRLRWPWSDPRPARPADPPGSSCPAPGRNCPASDVVNKN